MPFTLSQMIEENKSQLYEIVSEVCRRADLVVTVSEHSREQLKAIFQIDEERVVNTYQAVEDFSSQTKRHGAEIAAALETTFALKPREYILFCGSIEPRKNVARLIDAYYSAGTQYPLVICGPRGQSAETELRFADLPKQLRQAGFATSEKSCTALVLEYVPREVLRLLMAGARALLCPSISEGFGLPALEAMSLGTPVIASQAGALPEVCGDAATYVDPYDVSEIRKAIAALAQCPDDELDAIGKRCQAQAETFSAGHYDRRLMKAYEKASKAR